MLYADGKNASDISKTLGIDRRTVTKYLSDNSYSKNVENEQFLDNYKKLQEKSNKQILELIESTHYKNITMNILDLLDRKTLQKELEMRGMKTLVTSFGIFVDKAIQYEKLKLEREVKSNNANDHLINEDDNFNKAMLDAINNMGNHKELVAEESYVQED